MKKVSLILSAVVMTAMMISCGDNDPDEVATFNEASNYGKVTIGNQIWMTENLNVNKFRNGDPIPKAKSEEEWEKAGNNKQPAWCYHRDFPANGEKWGKLYNWYAVNDPRGLAPEGWHVPSDDEWSTLISHLGSEGGTKMKSTSGWHDAVAGPLKGKSGNGTNESGFSGLPGGGGGGNSFFSLGNKGIWWSSTEANTYVAWERYLDYNDDYVSRNYTGKGDGKSVRCLRD